MTTSHPAAIRACAQEIPAMLPPTITAFVVVRRSFIFMLYMYTYIRSLDNFGVSHVSSQDQLGELLAKPSLISRKSKIGVSNYTSSHRGMLARIMLVIYHQFQIKILDNIFQYIAFLYGFPWHFFYL